MRSAVRQVLFRSNDDLEFRTALLNGDGHVLAGYDLTTAEVSALVSGNEKQLYELLGDTKYFYIREQGEYTGDPPR